MVLALLLAACSTQQPVHERLGDDASTLVYECDGDEFVARSDGDRLVLYLAEDERVLQRVPAASGERYSDGFAVLHVKGPEAMLQLGPRAVRGCRLNPRRVPWEEARMRGVSFRALGQEPAWSLELQPGGQLLFVTGYGQRKRLFPTPEPRLEDSREVYRVEHQGQALRLEIAPGHCVDSMSGAVFDHRVRVWLNQREYRGCGASLVPR